MRSPLIALAALLLAGSNALACSCLPASRAEIIKDAAYVIDARVIATKLIERSNYSEIRAYVRVLRTLKGPRRRYTYLWTQPDSAMCGVAMTPGERRTFAAHGTRAKYTVGLCSNL